jgi:hypothetical protein
MSLRLLDAYNVNQQYIEALISTSDPIENAQLNCVNTKNQQDAKSSILQSTNTQQQQQSSIFNVTQLQASSQYTCTQSSSSIQPLTVLTPAFDISAAQQTLLRIPQLTFTAENDLYVSYQAPNVPQQYTLLELYLTAQQQQSLQQQQQQQLQQSEQSQLIKLNLPLIASQQSQLVRLDQSLLANAKLQSNTNYNITFNARMTGPILLQSQSIILKSSNFTITSNSTQTSTIQCGEFDLCSNHGQCSAITGKCDCQIGYGYEDCSIELKQLQTGNSNVDLYYGIKRTSSTSSDDDTSSLTLASSQSSINQDLIIWRMQWRQQQQGYASLLFNVASDGMSGGLGYRFALNNDDKMTSVFKSITSPSQDTPNDIVGEWSSLRHTGYIIPNSLQDLQFWRPISSSTSQSRQQYDFTSSLQNDKKLISMSWALGTSGASVFEQHNTVNLVMN